MAVPDVPGDASASRIARERRSCARPSLVIPSADATGAEARRRKVASEPDMSLVGPPPEKRILRILACSLARHWARDWRALAQRQAKSVEKK